MKPIFEETLENDLHSLGSLKYSVGLEAVFVKDQTFTDPPTRFYTMQRAIFNEVDPSKEFSELIARIENFVQNGSGWILNTLKTLWLDVAKYEPIIMALMLMLIRYLVISKNGNKNYVSLRTKKNIDLSNVYVNMTEDIVEFEAQNIAVISNITTVPNGNNLSIMQLNRHLSITPNVNSKLPEPWTFLFSAKFEEPLPNNSSILTFTTANQPSMYIYMTWSSGTFKYAITDTVMTNQNAISIDIDTTQFNHIAFEYVRNKLTLWVNGKSRKSHNVDLDNLSDIRIDAHQLGVVSLYNRELSKTEIAEHFVEYQVKNFSNDEVLI